MLTSTLRTVGGNASRPTRGASSRSKPAKPSKGQGSVRERLEQRWNRRWDERGRS